ncbi:MAG: hypothetical protein ACJ8KC_10175 [Candidatus Udaeobacter sp.]
MPPRNQRERIFSSPSRYPFPQIDNPGASRVAALQKIKDNDRVTNAPLLGRLRQSVKLPSGYDSLNSPVWVCSNDIASLIAIVNHYIV